MKKIVLILLVIVVLGMMAAPYTNPCYWSGNAWICYQPVYTPVYYPTAYPTPYYYPTQKPYNPCDPGFELCVM